MKAKKFSKRLILNKKTIANLNSNEMKAVQIGIATGILCPPTENTCIITCATDCSNCV